MSQNNTDDNEKDCCCVKNFPKDEKIIRTNSNNGNFNDTKSYGFFENKKEEKYNHNPRKNKCVNANDNNGIYFYPKTRIFNHNNSSAYNNNSNNITNQNNRNDSRYSKSEILKSNSINNSNNYNNNSYNNNYSYNNNNYNNNNYSRKSHSSGNFDKNYSNKKVSFNSNKYKNNSNSYNNHNEIALNANSSNNNCYGKNKNKSDYTNINYCSSCYYYNNNNNNNNYHSNFHQYYNKEKNLSYINNNNSNSYIVNPPTDYNNKKNTNYNNNNAYKKCNFGNCSKFQHSSNYYGDYKCPNNKYSKFYHKNKLNNIENNINLCSSPKSICTESTLVSISSNSNSINNNCLLQEKTKSTENEKINNDYLIEDKNLCNNYNDCCNYYKSNNKNNGVNNINICDNNNENSYLKSVTNSTISINSNYNKNSIVNNNNNSITSTNNNNSYRHKNKYNKDYHKFIQINDMKNVAIEIKELSRIVTYILFKILNYLHENPNKECNTKNENKNYNNIPCNKEKEHTNNYSYNNIIYNNIQSQKVISLSSIGPLNSKFNELYENEKVNIRKIQINNNYEVNINEINIIKDTSFANSTNANKTTNDDVNENNGQKILPMINQNNEISKMVNNNKDLTPRFSIEYTDEYDSNKKLELDEDNHNNVLNNKDNIITSSNSKNEVKNNFDNQLDMNICSLSDNKEKNSSHTTPSLSISNVDSNGRNDDFSDVNSNLSLLNSSIKSSSSTLLNFNSNCVNTYSSNNSDFATTTTTTTSNNNNNNVNNIFKPGLSLEKYSNPEIYKANSQISYPSSSNSFYETEFNSSMASSAIFSNASPYSQILPSPSYFSVASTSTNTSQCSYLSNPSLTILGNNFISNSNNYNYDNKILLLKRNFNQVQKQIEHILTKTCSYIPIFQVSIVALILIKRMRSTTNALEILKQLSTNNNSIIENEDIIDNKESILNNNTLTISNKDKQEKVDDNKYYTKIKSDIDNNENNEKVTLKKISYASVVRGDTQITNDNVVYSNLIPKKSTEQTFIKSSYGNLKDKLQKSTTKCLNEYPSLSESKNMEINSKNSTKLKKKPSYGSGGNLDKKINLKNSIHSEKESVISQFQNHNQHSKVITNNNINSTSLLENEYQQFLIAYIISIKLLDDNNWKNSSWSKSTEISLNLINSWESLFLKSINYNLYISEFEYNKWYNDFEKYRKESRDFSMFLSNNNNYWLNFNNNFSALNLKPYNYGAIKDCYYYYFNNNGNNNNTINNTNPFIYSESPRNELSTFVKNPYSFPMPVNYLGSSNSYDNLITFKNSFNPYDFSKNNQKKKNCNNCTNNNNNNINNANNNKAIYKKNNKLKDYQHSLDFNNKIYPNKKFYQDYNSTIHLNKIIKKNAYYFHYNS